MDLAELEVLNYKYNQTKNQLKVIVWGKNSRHLLQEKLSFQEINHFSDL